MSESRKKGQVEHRRGHFSCGWIPLYLHGGGSCSGGRVGLVHSARAAIVQRGQHQSQSQVHQIHPVEATLWFVLIFIL